MSQENVEIIRRGIDAWNRGDRDEWLAGWAPEAEWHTTGLALALAVICSRYSR